ncbi:MAG: 3-hydroxyacyl-CoA dehydrogenase [SAR86 cluster bacterium BACL1 MAG-120920-bin57]|uniref:3-hydroxyacyl-CoA dehydrogenase n=2 Tax=SAR86 cluster TaxID=62672 RepID=A0A0R2UD01_9GAMM|nr:MAG: 3-hydroxyacyl-CoA dehydrogenase [SAR86 cluster bacterium BACL1 MAG-120920-bin57]KRO95243.1 MAG: 3-hydroxyacyl-CoA dehydrogenase [SAR86 cluster bacterium BACL1 MAG-120820-bin45]KRO98364.1 MAG: 3-hydroxyacyl-CoA dehydrogenase [SAR86 cluster bacterium BACL1 MAG-120813-bin36]KRO98971.1 MAG: 3-hydroxyacyl-CoA dehydrogenase [SAR86 cluster bacterium BACL1 MAG-120823-bin87]KRP02014.1 MAG: 3-hydroxyacyl-CoA dehydrogenase [SAR86 cluster bacterium BACL1 MAG-120619-bin26]KRP15082.1 MAG: 3-hydroxya
MKGKVNYTIQGNIAILEVDNPPVNPLSSGVRAGLSEYIKKANEDDSVQGIILTGAGRSFIAGADISEFGQKPDGPDLHTTLRDIEFSTKPVVAAINGTALGGGLETALVCNYRIGTNNAIVGLPEVNLGLLPGAGGTQRLPRLIGPSAALKMMLAGNPMSAKKALHQGVIDAISENSLIEDAIVFLQDKIGLDSHPKVRDKNEKIIEARGNINVLTEARALAAKTRKGQFAPGQIIACVEAAINEDNFDDGMKKEADYFLECLLHPQREAMIHIFFGERAASKISDVPKDTPLLPINSAGVVGSGTMGGGIAMNFANAGVPVFVLDQDEKNLTQGMSVIERNYQMMVDRGRMLPEQKDAVMNLITPTLRYEDLSEVDIAVEAVYENLALKQEIFKSLDMHINDNAILASNTSGLDIDAIASVTNRPEKVVGTHFFSPANIMRLLEVVKGEVSSNETMATVMSIGKRMGKAAVVSLNAPGFIGNRMLSGYTYQANMLLLEGALPNQIDNALESFGMSMGPFRMMDLVGLDLGWRARKLAELDTPLANKISDALCELERFGQKNGKGFYNYSEGSRAPNPAPENQDIYESISNQNNIVRREISDQEIIDRCILALVNEGAQILAEGVAQRSGDMDIVYINGYGFPIWRGGPMFYANKLGLDKVIKKLNEFSAMDHNFWKPAPLLEKLAAEGQFFGEAPEIEKRDKKLTFKQSKNMGGV